MDKNGEVNTVDILKSSISDDGLEITFVFNDEDTEDIVVVVDEDACELLQSFIIEAAHQRPEDGDIEIEIDEDGDNDD